MKIVNKQTIELLYKLLSNSLSIENTIVFLVEKSIECNATKIEIKLEKQTITVIDNGKQQITKKIKAEAPITVSEISENLKIDQALTLKIMLILISEEFTASSKSPIEREIKFKLDNNNLHHEIKESNNIEKTNTTHLPENEISNKIKIKLKTTKVESEKIRDRIALSMHKNIEHGVQISINNEIIKADNPLTKSNKKTRLLETKTHIKNKRKASIKGYILPFNEELEKETPSRIYIYRNNTLINTSKLKKEERTKALKNRLRIEVAINDAFDEEANLDRFTSRIEVPKSIEAAVDNYVIQALNSFDKERKGKDKKVTFQRNAKVKLTIKQGAGETEISKVKPTELSGISTDSLHELSSLVNELKNEIKNEVLAREKILKSHTKEKNRNPRAEKARELGFSNEFIEEILERAKEKTNE